MNFLTKFLPSIGFHRPNEARPASIHEEGGELFRRMFDQSPIPIVLVSLKESRLLEANPAAMIAFEFADRLKIGHSLADLALWRDPAEQQRYRELLLATGSVTGFEMALRTNRGHSIDVLMSGSLINIGGDQCSINFLQDITERKRSERGREQSAALVRATLESTADGILTIDASGRIESYNRRFVEMWRIPEDILAARDDARALEWVSGQLKDPESFRNKVEHLYNHPLKESFDTLEFVDGRVIERYSRPMLLDGQPTGRVWSFRDISARRVAEAAIRFSEEKFRGVFDQSPVMIGLLTVPDGRFVEANAAGIAAFGYTREELIGRTSVELNLWVNAADRDRYLDMLKTHGSIQGFETAMQRKNGEQFIALYSGSLIKIGDQTFSLNSLQDITPRKRAEESLRTSEQRYERVVQNISDALLIDDADGRVVFANARFRELFGLPEDIVLSTMRLEDYVAPPHRQLLRDRHDRRIRGEAVPDSYNYEAMRPDGTRFWVEVNVTTVIENGIITGTQSLNRDVTDRRITEQAMLLLSTGTATLRGRAFYEHIAAEAARLFDADMGAVVRCSSPDLPKVQTLGVSLDGRILPMLEYAMVDTPCVGVLENKCVIHPSGVARLFPKFALLTEQGMEGYAAAPMRSLGGEILGYVSIVARRPIRHRPALLESVLQMIAFKVAAEVEREEAESKFRDLFAFAPDSVLIATQQGVVTDANERALEMFGYTLPEITGRRVENLIPEDVRPELMRRLSLYLANPVPHALGTSAPGLMAVSKSGRRFPIDISLSPLKSDRGMLVVAAIRDITQQVRATELHQQIEAQLRQAQKMESLGTLAGGIAHDFNNILTGMLGFVELARVDLPANHPAQEWIKSLSSTGERAKNLVRQILTFSRKDEGERTVLRLQLVAEEAVRLLRATIPAMIEIETDFFPDCPPVLADSNQIHQVIINLCTNSWHAMPKKGGRIRVAVNLQPPPLDGTNPPFVPAEPHVCLTVTDNGEGMDRHTLDRIFDPFFTTKKTGEGTGLGLAVVHGIVQSHSGFIKVRSKPGHGTVFELYFPVSAAPALPPPEEVDQLPRGHGEHCLLLDDDAASGKALAHLLIWLGYRVTLHHEPLAALAVFRESPGQFAVVISDLAMPGLTGIQFARYVRTLAPATPLMMISGFVTPEQQQELRSLGVTDILRKPPTLDELARVVARCIDRN